MGFVLYVLSGKHGIFQAILERWCVCGGYMGVSEMVVFMNVATHF